MKMESARHGADRLIPVKLIISGGETLDRDVVDARDHVAAHTHHPEAAKVGLGRS